jgi:nucleotide-binding universal stress UspA family protein
MVREILFATDFSPASEGAAAVAFEYAPALKARLHVLHVVTDGQGDATPAMTQLAQRSGGTLQLVTATVHGEPAEEIVRYADHHAIDLIVVGTHGRTGVTRALLGSVAERVARTASCPVLTVPHTVAAPAPAKEVEPPPALRRCLVCSRASVDLICTSCRTQIRGEALESKRQAERKGRP